MKQFDSDRLPAVQIWTDLDLIKYTLIAFTIGLIIGAIL